MSTTPAHPLRQRRFLYIWAASFFTEISRWSLLIALPLYALTLTGSALVTSTVAMLGLLPSLILTPLAGVFADRWRPAPLMAWLAGTRALLLLPLLLVAGEGDLWIVYLVMAAESGLTGMFESVKNAVVPTLVPSGQLVRANASINLNSNLGRLVGSPVGGFLLGFTGMASVVLTSVAMLVVTVVLVALMGSGAARRVTEDAVVPGAETSGPAFWRELPTGLRAIGSSARLRSVALILGLLSVAQGLFVILFLLFVTDLIAGGEPEAGLLRGVQAIGGLLGGAVAGRMARRLQAHQFLAYGLLSFALISLAIWNLTLVTAWIGFYIGLFTLAGVPGIWLMAGWLSLVQEATPEGLRGRVMSTFIALSDGQQALGMMLAGVLAGLVPTLAALNFQAAVLLLAWLLAARLLKPAPVTPQAGPVQEARERDTSR
ncbi:MFS transporter [Sphaerisporangium rubeum]|uniref:MFS family permease n=1 Tax=Sphaerisporangium rubeum TaxID=321317 RepID=A0A7X0IJ07_9ACTN|nr:MFS transporter [Sphaerisporangium rubeum]MBB6474883.1 MFS family permease [Sphaerisporangium rubeum]